MTSFEKSGAQPESAQQKDTRPLETLVKDYLADGFIDENEAKELLARFEQDKGESAETARRASEMLQAEIV